MLKVLKVKKVKVCTNRSCSLTQETKHLVSSPGFNSVTSHYVLMSHICIIYVLQLVWNVRID